MTNTDYELLIGQAEALIQGVPHLVANLANVSALIFTTLEDINWAGFYLLKSKQSRQQHTRSPLPVLEVFNALSGKATLPGTAFKTSQHCGQCWVAGFDLGESISHR